MVWSLLPTVPRTRSPSAPKAGYIEQAVGGVVGFLHGWVAIAGDEAVVVAAAMVEEEEGEEGEGHLGTPLTRLPLYQQPTSPTRFRPLQNSLRISKLQTLHCCLVEAVVAIVILVVGGKAAPGTVTVEIDCIGLGILFV
jgi:hypothetical protein